jgi:hypothetical protein
VTTSGQNRAAGWSTADGAPVVLLDPAGATDVRAVGILPDGKVIGVATVSSHDRGVVWPDATVLGAPTLLPTPEGFTDVTDVAAGLDGSIIGQGEGPGVQSAVHWTSPEASPTVLNTLPGASGASAVGASPAGVIVGNLGPGGDQAVAWFSPSGDPIRLHPPTDLHDAEVVGVTNDGRIVGVANDSDGSIHLVVWRTATSPGLAIRSGPDPSTVSPGMSLRGVSPGARVVGISPPQEPRSAFLFELG